ncbi:hypothetical protein [Paramicrobacterium agarici]|uniref:hypothetical protein n=1 Tax=Paramicrobacterium agarici TaxID=630514 RepID=UPI001154B109|nr:hypothetical protein [Microbacterium agarici]
MTRIIANPDALLLGELGREAWPDARRADVPMAPGVLARYLTIAISDELTRSFSAIVSQPSVELAWLTEMSGDDVLMRAVLAELCWDADAQILPRRWPAPDEARFAWKAVAVLDQVTPGDRVVWVDGDARDYEAWLRERLPRGAELLTVAPRDESGLTRGELVQIEAFVAGGA